MSWSNWMPIYEAGYVGTAPYSVFNANFGRYHESWRAPQWRYDKARGYVEYRGLVKNVNTLTTQGNIQMAVTYLDISPALPKPTGNMIYRSMTSLSGANDAFRVDLWPHATAHHELRAEMNGTGTVGVGNWYWLEIMQSLSDNDPEFLPWTNIGTTANGVTSTLYSHWSVYTPNGGWMVPQYRTTPDYRRWQWRGLMGNAGGALGLTPPYMEIANLTHPNPHTGRMNILNAGIMHYSWIGGNVASCRVDALATANGHRIVYTSTDATTPNYLPLNFDYDLRPFG